MAKPTGMLHKRVPGEDIVESIRAGIALYQERNAVKPDLVCVPQVFFAADLKVDGVEIRGDEDLTKPFIWVGFKS